VACLDSAMVAPTTTVAAVLSVIAQSRFAERIRQVQYLAPKVRLEHAFVKITNEGKR